MLTKQFSIDKVSGKIVKSDYDCCYLYDYDYAECNNIVDLYDLLQWLGTEYDRCIIRGKLRDNIDISHGVRRKKLAVTDPFMENPDGVNFIMCDFDKIDIPDWLPTDLDYYVEYLISTLPSYMHDVTYVYQWSSQAGMDGWKTLRCHIWFWLTEARTDTQAEEWVNSLIIGNYKPVDPCTMRTVQPNYTANPIFHDNIQDPLDGSRVGIVNKSKQSVVIPIILQVPRFKQSSTGVFVNVNVPTGLDTKFDLRLAEIGPDYHMPITRAIGSWISLTGPFSDIDRLKERLRHRILCAPGEGGAGQSHYLSDAYLDAEVAGCPFNSKHDGPNRMPETPSERMRYKLSCGKKI